MQKKICFIVFMFIAGNFSTPAHCEMSTGAKVATGISIAAALAATGISATYFKKIYELKKKVKELEQKSKNEKDAVTRAEYQRALRRYKWWAGTATAIGCLSLLLSGYLLVKDGENETGPCPPKGA